MNNPLLRNKMPRGVRKGSELAKAVEKLERAHDLIEEAMELAVAGGVDEDSRFEGGTALSYAGSASGLCMDAAGSIQDVIDSQEE